MGKPSSPHLAHTMTSKNEIGNLQVGGASKVVATMQHICIILVGNLRCSAYVPVFFFPGVSRSHIRSARDQRENRNFDRIEDDQKPFEHELFERPAGGPSNIGWEHLRISHEHQWPQTPPVSTKPMAESRANSSKSPLGPGWALVTNRD